MGLGFIYFTIDCTGVRDKVRTSKWISINSRMRFDSCLFCFMYSPNAIYLFVKLVFKKCVQGNVCSFSWIYWAIFLLCPPLAFSFFFHSFIHSFRFQENESKCVLFVWTIPRISQLFLVYCAEYWGFLSQNTGSRYKTSDAYC